MLLAVGRVVGGVVVVPFRPNTRSNIKVAKLQIFNKKTSKVLKFLTLYILYIRMRMKKTIVEEQIQYVLLYMQEGLADI